MAPKLVPPIDAARPGAIPEPCLASLLRQHGYDTAFMQPATERFAALVRQHLTADSQVLDIGCGRGQQTL